MKIDWISFGMGAAVGGAAFGVGTYLYLNSKADEIEEESFESENPQYDKTHYVYLPVPYKDYENIVDGYSTESDDDDIEPDRNPEIETIDLEPEQEKEVNAVAKDFITYMEEEVGVNPKEDGFKEPYVISYGEFENENPQYDKIHLAYFPAYGILITDEEEIVDSPTRMIGRNVIDFIDEAAEHGGFDMKENPLVYVRNDGWGTDYEVELRTKLQASGWLRDYMEGLDA